MVDFANYYDCLLGDDESEKLHHLLLSSGWSDGYCNKLTGLSVTIMRRFRRKKKISLGSGGKLAIILASAVTGEPPWAYL